MKYQPRNREEWLRERHGYVQVLRARAGRIADAMTALRDTDPEFELLWIEASILNKTIAGIEADTRAVEFPEPERPPYDKFAIWDRRELEALEEDQRNVDRYHPSYPPGRRDDDPEDGV
jgi:hypothetical protein